MDVPYAERYVDEIADGPRSGVDPANAADYAAGAAPTQARLADLDDWVRAKIATIPEANRRIVTFHDAFPYFAREYGIDDRRDGRRRARPGPDAPATSPSSSTQIKASGVKAIFSEAQFPSGLVDQLAAETGVKVVANLYDDSVGDPPADTLRGRSSPGTSTDRRAALAALTTPR